MLKRLILTGFLSFLGLLAAVAAQQSPARSLQTQLQATFEELHKAGSFPGGTAGIVLADGTPITIAVGVSDRAAGTTTSCSTDCMRASGSSRAGRS